MIDTMMEFAIFFRSINVGGRKVPMAQLKDFLASLGFSNIATYIQSGNVVCSSIEENREDVKTLIENEFHHTFGFHSDVLLRTKKEIDGIVANNSFLKEAVSDPAHFLVMFLDQKPTKEAIQLLQNSYVGPEKIAVVSENCYLYYPEGIGRSKLTASLLEKKLQVIGTARNWNTLLKMQKMFSA